MCSEFITTDNAITKFPYIYFQIGKIYTYLRNKITQFITNGEFSLVSEERKDGHNTNRRRDKGSYLDVSVILLHVFESLEVKGENGGQPLHSHPFVRFLAITRGY